MTLKTSLSAPQRARGFAAIMLSIVFIAAGGAMAKNHDAQRIKRDAAHASNHDRAAGPLEASNALDHHAE